MTEKQQPTTLLGQAKTPEQRAVLDAIGYGDDLPAMDAATTDYLLHVGLIEADGNSCRMPEAVHKAWFSEMLALARRADDLATRLEEWACLALFYAAQAPSGTLFLQ